MASRRILKEIQHSRQGRAESQLALGKCYLTGGEGLPANHLAAYRWLSAAADQGLAEAAWLIGESVPAQIVDSPGRARSYYEIAADHGSAAAMTALARWQLAGTFGPEGPTLAISRLRAAASRGYLEAQLELGAMACRGNAPAEDIEWLKMAAERGSRDAAKMLATHYWESGRGDLWRAGQVPGERTRADLRSADEQEDLSQALSWHELAWPETQWRSTPREQAYVRGCLLLRAQRHDALRWLEMAGSAGHPQAAYVRGLVAMGSKYLNTSWTDEAPQGPRGQRWPRNYKWAARWLEMSGKGRLPEAFIALWLLHGIRGVTLGKRDIRDDFLRQAAELGHTQAAHLLACQLWRPKARTNDDVEAIRWWHHAARRGLPAARERLCATTMAGRETLDASQASALRALARHDQALAARLELGLWCNLMLHECLLLDLDSADAGEFLVVDVRSGYGKAKRRFVRMESPGQIEAIGRARHVLGNRRASPGDLAGDYASRKRQFMRLCKSTGIEAASIFQGASSGPLQ